VFLQQGHSNPFLPDSQNGEKPSNHFGRLTTNGLALGLPLALQITLPVLSKSMTLGWGLQAFRTPSE
jgi:hypothetical protein